MADATKKAENPQIPPDVPVHERRRSRGNYSAIFKNADKIVGSKLPPGTSLTVEVISSESSGVEFTTQTGSVTTSVFRINGLLNYQRYDRKTETILASYSNHPNDIPENKVIPYKDAVVSRASDGFINRKASDLIMDAMDDAVVRAFHDGRFSQREALQFERARDMIIEAVIDRDLTVPEAQNIVRHLNTIAPKTSK